MHKKTLKIVKRLRRFFKESIGRTMRSCMCVVLAKNLFMIQSLLNKMLVYVTRENIHESFSPFVPIVIYIWLKCKYPEVVFALCMESLLSGVSADNEFGRTQLPDAPTQREMELSSLSFSNLSSQPLLSDKKSREKVKQEHFQSLSSWSTASQKNISSHTKRAQHKMLRALLCFRVEGYFPLNIGPAKYNKLTTAEEERLMFQTTDNKNRKCHRNDLPDNTGSLLL